MNNPALKIAIVCISMFLLWCVYDFTQEQKKSGDTKDYIRSLNFKMTGKVKKVSVYEEIAKGVVFITNVRTNKQGDYKANFKGKYLLCKISNDEAILVGPNTNEMQPNDSLSINSDRLKCAIYRNGVHYSDYALYIYDNDNFYDYIHHADWLNFDYYKK